jgi:predicted phosphodiesterase
MKLIALGDTHGRSKWKEIVEKENDADKIIFIGDYFDAKDGGYSANLKERILIKLYC